MQVLTPATILLMPGMDGTGKLFRPLLKSLPEEFTPKVVAYPCDRVLTFDELLGCIEVPEEPFIIVAESFSGPLAILLAARRPRHLMGLVLVATFVRNPCPLPARWLRLLARPTFFRLPLPDFLLQWVLLGNGASVDSVTELRAALQLVRPEVMAARLREVVDTDVTKEFKALSVPLLYVAGRRDRIVPRRVIQDLRSLRPDLQVATLDAPHLILQRRPVGAADLIARFCFGHF